jgi:hypothetical protein
MKSFISNENKGLLWGLMAETNAFGGLPEGKFSQVKDIFEKEIIIQYQSNTSKTLTELNKKFLVEVTNKLHPIRTPSNHDLRQITSSDISQQRQSEFSNNLSVRQREFAKLINADTPQEIDFSDANSRIPPEDNIVDDIDSIIARRAHQLSNVVASHDKVSASKWIGREDKPTLTIGGKIENERIDVLPQKTSKVAFSDPDRNESAEQQIDLKDFLSQLSDNRDTIIHEIKEIYSEVIVGMRRLDILIKKLE